MNDYTKRNFRLNDISQLEYELAYTSPDFENIVISHILGNYVKNSPFPLYLAIHGPKGEGKTFQTLRTCVKYEIAIYYISGAELCGSYEKDSIISIEKNLDDAIRDYREKRTLSVFIIDDFHLSIASVDAGVSKTVNSQILTGWLMNLADRAKAGSSSRIPFIFLGNDFANLYPPLTRDGRMDFYEWTPAKEIKEKIICRHFEDYITKKDQTEKFLELISAYVEQPVSFFAELKKDLLKNLISKRIVEMDIKDPVDLLNGLNGISEEMLMDESFDMVSQLSNLAKSRKKQSDAKITLHEDRGNL